MIIDTHTFCAVGICDRSQHVQEKILKTAQEGMGDGFGNPRSRSSITVMMSILAMLVHRA